MNKVCNFFYLNPENVKLTFKIKFKAYCCMKFHKNLKIKRTYLNVYESQKKLNKIEFLKTISNYYKNSGTKHPIKELSFLILPCPKHTGT